MIEGDHDHGNVSTDIRCAQNKSCCGTVAHLFRHRVATRLPLVVFRTGPPPTYNEVTGSLRSPSSGILAGLYKEGDVFLSCCPRAGCCAFGRSPHCEVLLSVPQLRESFYMSIRPLILEQLVFPCYGNPS